MSIDQGFREMKGIARPSMFAGVMLLGASFAVSGLDSGELALTTVRAVRSLSAQQAAGKKPVHLQGVVTALSGWKDSFFLQDKTAGISIDRSDRGPRLKAGDFVAVEGVSGPGMFAPVVIAGSVSILGTRPLPNAPVFELGQLMSGTQDSQRLAVRGVVRSADAKSIWGRTVLSLRLETATGELTARVLDFSGDTERLVDA